MENELKRLLKLIEAVPCVLPEEEEKGIFYDLTRVNTINDEINKSNSNYKWVNGNDYYRLYAQDTLDNLAKEYSRVLLVSSHADNLQDCSSYDDKSNPGYINGCFDNASTNAVSVYLMNNIKLPRNVLFVFTADEEYDSEGAEHVASKIVEKFGKGSADVIVLDVTYGFQGGVDFTIENDFIFDNQYGEDFIYKVCKTAKNSGYSWNFLKKTKKKDKYIDSKTIKENMGEGCISYSEVKGADETKEYKTFNFNTFSLCLPCSAKDEDQMHDDKGFEISIKTICNYLDFLKQLIQ